MLYDPFIKRKRNSFILMKLFVNLLLVSISWFIFFTEMDLKNK